MAKKPNDDKYDVLLNTKRDSTVLMIFWYIHKSFWAVLLLGLLFVLLFGDIHNAWLDLRNSRNVLFGSTAPVIGLLIAILCKLIADNIFTLTAYPLLRKRQLDVEKKAGNVIFRFFDQWRDLRGISTLRWTHAVRQQAMLQFDSKFFRSDRINNSIDLITLCSLTLCVLMLLV